jgi:CheY-like chemotaxis protein/Tfp pilus assembly protein PilZ
MGEPADPEARRGGRVEAAFRVRYHSIDQLVVALTHDLSRGGLFMRTGRFLPINAIVRVHLDLPDDGGEIPIVCRVVFVRGEAEARESGKPAGMGVEFIDFDSARMTQINAFVAARSEARSAAASPDARAPATRRRLDIVLVDDDSSIRAPIAAALTERGDRVREAEDGLDGLALCLKQTPDLVLSDLQMPRMDGWTLVRMLRARPSLQRVPVILFSTLADDEARLRGYRLGVDDYIAKPVETEELIVRIDRVVARTQHSSAQERRSLRGDLEHVALASLLSFLALEQKTGVLLLVGGDATSRVFMRAGVPLRIEIDDVPIEGLDDPALFGLLNWTRGSFEFAAGDVACSDELATNVNVLLLEHARRSDEVGE